MSSDLAARLNTRLAGFKAMPAPEGPPNSPADIGFIPSRRTTSNSRGPGQTGTVHVRARQLVICICGVRWYGGAVHAPHFNRAGVLVDCQGKAVPR